MHAGILRHYIFLKNAWADVNNDNVPDGPVAVAVADADAVAVLLLFRYLSNGGGSLSLYPCLLKYRFPQL